MRKSIIVISMLVFAGLAASACATKGFVREEIGLVSGKVDSLTEALEATQEQTEQNGTRIGEVDERAGAAQSAADRASTEAGAADARAGSAGDAADSAMSRANAVGDAANRVVYEVVLSENQGNFTFGGSTLPDVAKATIDQLIAQIKADPKGAYFEIEGHTDNVGDATYNMRLGLERAEAVKMYLYEQHTIPLHRMNVISYGEDKPAGDNATREGRAQNRRVVLRVVA